jgi:hypothetical protein
MNTNEHIIQPNRRFSFASPLSMLVVLAVVIAAALSGPSDRLLGGNLGLILLHGSWVWTGMLLFAASALVGLAAVLAGRARLHVGSLALARTGLAFWLTYLPMSLLVMQMNWGGLFFDEPRWRIPFTFAVVSVLLQVGLLLIDRPVFASTANILFGAALWYSLRSANTVLHPESPIPQSGATIQLFFLLLMALALLLAAQLAAFQYRRMLPRA